MLENENKKIDNIEKLVETIAISVSKLNDKVEVLTDNVEVLTNKVDSIEERMATKEDLVNLELKLTTEIQDLRMDLKSFKKDTEYNTKEIINDAIDLTDTVMGQDKRIEKLENKVFA